MQPPRFFCHDLPDSPADSPWPQRDLSALLDDAEAQHALHSRRLHVGDAVTLFDGRGGVASGTLLADVVEQQHSARGRTARERPSKTRVAISDLRQVPAPRRTLTLLVAGCKGSRLDWLVEKCTELGVTRLVLTEFARSVVRVSATHVVKLRRTAIEACKQSGRAWLPEIEAGVTLADALAGRTMAAPVSADQSAGQLLVAEPDPTATPLATWLSAHGAECERLAVVIGPEGGLAPEELALLRDAGGHLIRLAEHVLRVETAAVSVAANWAALL